jgi:tape measure domain-containing protein
MGFDAAKLVATIRLEGVEKVGRDLEGVKRQMQSTDQVAGQVRRSVSSVFRDAAVGAGTATAAGAAYLAVLFKQGVAYNTLQQTSRAALKTLLGGAEAANAQMDKLDAFARNSPFSKSVFIQAQQQLIGFGFEASKVIPTLDAVQNAVAAVGGSNQQIGEIVTILAKIRSSGKITAEDLNQLGERGLDAATLLGQGFGKSAGEIRESITKGTIDAGQAIDILVSQMDAKFAGAASNVKQTFSGTVDRIKAASRDIGAALAEPFVSKNGGGLAVTWGNQIADVMRAAEKHVTPLVSMLMERASPAVASFTQQLDHARVVVKAWDPSRVSDGLDQLAAYGPGIGAVAGSVLAVNASLLGGVPVVGRFFSAVNPVAGALLGVAAASPEVRAALGEVFAELQPLVPAAGQLARVFAATLAASLPIVASGLDLVATVAGPVVDIISSIPPPVLAAVAAFIAVRNALGPVADMAPGVADGVSAVMESFRASKATADAMGGSVTVLGAATSAAGVAVTGIGTALKAAFISNPVGIALLVISGAAAALTAVFADQAAKVQETKDRIAEYRTTLDDATGAQTDATRALLAEAASSEEWSAKLKDGGVSTRQFTDALAGVPGAADQVRNALVRTAQGDMLESTFEKSKNLAEDLGVSLDTLTAATLGYPDAQKEVRKALDESGAMFAGYEMRYTELTDRTKDFASASRDIVAYIGEQRDALEEAQSQQRQYRDAIAQASQAMSDAERSNTRLNDAISIARDTSADATERIRALRQAIDELKGGSLSAAEAQIRQAEVNNSLADSLTAVDDNGRKAYQTLLDGAGAIDLSSAAGTNLANQMVAASDAYLSVASAAYDAAIANGQTMPEATKAAESAAQGYIDTLRQTFTEAGLTQAQIDGLISKYFALPSTVSTLVTDDGTITTTEQRLLTLAEQINATPNKTVIVDEPFSPIITANLESLGFKIRTLPDGRIEVSASGVENVESSLQRLTRSRTATITVIQRRATAPDTNGDASGNGQMGTNANGGFWSSPGVRAFANGGEAVHSSLPSGIYRGTQRPIYKFAELETKWEAFISGKPGQEARNRKVLAVAAQRLGMEVMPRNAPARAFADGAFVTRTPTTATVSRQELPARAGAKVQVTFVNPVQRDVVDDARAASEVIGAALDV